MKQWGDKHRDFQSEKDRQRNWERVNDDYSNNESNRKSGGIFSGFFNLIFKVIGFLFICYLIAQMLK